MNIRKSWKLVVSTFKPLISWRTWIVSVSNYTWLEVLALWLYSTLTHYYTSRHTVSTRLLLSCPFSFIESASFFTGVSLIHLLSSFDVHLLVFPTIREYQTNYRDSPSLPNVMMIMYIFYLYWCLSVSRINS